jgi:hypothetical protein
MHGLSNPARNFAKCFKIKTAPGPNADTARRFRRNTDRRRVVCDVAKLPDAAAWARLQHASGAAVSTLLKVMVDQEAPATSRTRAADSVLRHAANAAELEELESRIQSLEQLAQKNN